ncbi:hypothetical protein AVEN_39769-1 [Araneus ventricosus]|uniref:Uncharacterized protein n=1 Tax=Araneus ventricosus TaxID=182803 RepID=A0A4Y2GHP2_ARAVE|nr:hypothetical protein AVEN_39769-1 [Araneus ventricosus]
MTPHVFKFVLEDRLLHEADTVSSLLSFPNRNIYLLLTMPTPYEKEIERLRKLLAEDEIMHLKMKTMHLRMLQKRIFEIMKVSANLIQNRKEILEMKK